MNVRLRDLSPTDFPWKTVCTSLFLITFCLLAGGGSNAAPKQKEPAGQLSWEMPGRLSIYDLEFGPALLKDNKWQFQGDIRALYASRYRDRLTLMVRFSYNAPRAGIPLKFVVQLPQSRPYEETVQLGNPSGQFDYTFTIHRPDEFVGSGSVYLYYGFSIVDVLDFTILPGTERPAPS